MALNDTERELARQASFGDDIMSQREAAVSIADMQSDIIDEPQDSGWEDVNTEWEDVGEWEDISPTKDTTATPNIDPEVLANLPENLTIAGLEVPVDKRTAAFFVGAGDAMTWAYRGIKQLAGIDEEKMALDQQYMDKLYQADTVGGYARGGQIWGSFFEPAGMLAPVGKAKNIKTAFGKGAAVGAGYGALGYVDKESGQTRLGNSLLGGTLGGAFNGAFQGLKLRGDKKAIARANEDMDNFELAYAESLLEGVPKDQAHVYAFQKMPKNFSVIHASEQSGRRFNPPSNIEEAKELVHFYKGTSQKSDLAMGADSWVGITSTRIRNISERIAGHLRKHDKNVLTNQHHYFTRVDKFLEQYNDAFSGMFGANKREAMDKALLDGDFLVAEREMQKAGGDKLVQAFREVRNVLDELGDQAKDLGIIEGKLQNYFPRYITDHKKMLESLGRHERSVVEEAIKKARLKAGRELSAVQESDIINKALRGYVPKEGKSPFTKARSYKHIPPHLLQYYAKPEESLHSYIRNMVNDIEKHKFFGRNLKKIKTGTAEIFDVDESVGAFLREEMKTNPMSSTELKELAGLLQTRFGIGERSPANLTQNAKNLMYISLLGNPISAATQLGDLGVAVYMNGFRNTIKALPKAILGKSEVRVKDWGLTDQLAEEFATTKRTSRWLNRAFTYSGFKYIDRLGKDTAINAAFNKFKSQVKTTKGLEKFRAKYGKYLGNDIEKTIKDLKAGKASEEVQTLLFGELADVQPISLSEVPEMYLKLPNGRVAYMLKTFMLKQVDILRKDAYNEIKKGNIAKGLYNASRYAVLMGAAGTGSQQIKNEILYLGSDEPTPKEVERFEDIPAAFGMNALKTFGWSEYVLNSLKEGRPYKAAMDAFAPPFDIVDKIIAQDPNAIDYMPIAGKIYNYWFQDGAKNAIERKQKREEEKLYGDIIGNEEEDLLKKYGYE